MEAKVRFTYHDIDERVRLQVLRAIEEICKMDGMERAMSGRPQRGMSRGFLESQKRLLDRSHTIDVGRDSMCEEHYLNECNRYVLLCRQSRCYLFSKEDAFS